MTESEYRAALAQAERYDIVRLRWRDSSHIGLGWRSPDAYVDSMDSSRFGLEESAGYFIASNDAYVLVCLSMRQFVDDTVDTITEAMMIPHEAIRLFEIIRKGTDLDRSTGLDNPEASEHTSDAGRTRGTKESG